MTMHTTVREIVVAANQEALNVALKSGDKAAITAAHGEMGKSCGGCHEPYREKKT